MSDVRNVLPWIAVLAGLCGCGGGKAAAPKEPIVARWDGLEVTQRVLDHAIAARADAEAVRRDGKLSRAVILDLLVDEALARETRSKLPEVVRRGEAAGRATAVRLLLEQAVPADRTDRAGETVDPSAAASRRGIARREILARLGGTGGVPSRQEEDLLLASEAKRLGLDRHPAVAAATRAEILLTWQGEIERELSPAGLPAAEVRAVYDGSLGDYTQPRRVRVAALVTRSRERAAGWARKLAAERYPGALFEKLLDQESEEVAARQTRGELGWIDGRSTHVPPSFIEATLHMQRPGDVSGALEAAGAFHVLLCLDFQPEVVSPFEAVEPKIRAELAARRVRERMVAERERVRANIVLEDR